MDFTNTKDTKAHFTRYAVDLNCQNSIADIRKNTLPSLEELVEGATHQPLIGLKSGCETREGLDRALWVANNTSERPQDNMGPFN